MVRSHEPSSAGRHEIAAEDPDGQAGHFSMNKKAKWEHRRDENMGRQQTGNVKALPGYRGTKSHRLKLSSNSD